MKSPLSQMFNFGGQARHRDAATGSGLANQNLQYERLLKEKDREIDQLRHQLNNVQSRLQELMGTDVLTGLPNRHTFKEHLTNSLKRAMRFGYCLSIIVLDIDHLRELNLRHGHDIGDEALTEIAGVLRSSVREVDMPARWGGEELVAVLHETDTEGATTVAERIRRRIAMLEIKDPKNTRPIHVTATLAVASYPGHNNDPQALLEMAFDAIADAKAKGGNRVMVASKSVG